MFVPVSWAYTPTPSTISAWRIYASETEDARGVLAREVDAAERSTEIEVGEGTFYVRIVGLYRDGTEAPWESAPSSRLDVSGQETTPSAPENVNVAAVDPQSARVEADPPVHDDGDGSRIQVLEMPDGETDPALGTIVAEHVETIGGPLAPRGVRQPGPLVAVEGSGDLMPTTRRLAVRRVTPFGAASPATIVDVPVVDRPNHYTIAVASVSGTTLVGFASPASTDPWETDATDGVRLKHLPVVDDWDTDYGYPDDWGGDSPLTADGVLRENRYFGAYADFARLSLAATKDLGGVVDFVLEAWHPVFRSSVEGCVEDEVVNDWDFPIDALGAVADLTDVDAKTRVSGAVGVFRDSMLDGTPMPLTRDAARLLYVVGTSLPLSTDPADRKPYVPGAVLRGRYLDVYLELREPSGMHQLTMPKCVVNARVLMRRTVSDAAPSHAAPPGSIHVDKTAGKVYVKTSGVSTSGHTEMATKAYVDAAVAGLDWKPSVRVATTGALTLATDVEAGDVIDGVTLVAGDRVLVKNQASGAENGIYVVPASGAPARATDADSSAEVTAGLAVFVAEGTTLADTCWVLTTNDTITLGSTALVFTQFGVGGGGSTPTGTGFRHVTSGAEDAAAKLVESADVDAALKDPAAATAGLRTLGTSGTSACAGNDSRLSDARAPDINGLTAETAVDRDADYVPVYDASATANRKMRVRDLAAGALVRSTTHYDVGPADATEQTIFTGTVPANCMGTDRMLRLAIRGTAKNQTGSGRAFQIRVNFGGSTLLDFTINLASSATLTTFWVDVEIQNDAATNAQNVTAKATLPGASAPATGTAGGSVGAAGIRTVEGVGTVDTTSDQTLAVTLQLPVSDANLYADIERGMLELV